MANNDVNAQKIYEITGEIANIIQNITSDVENINNSCVSLINNCTEFMEYNGQEVSGSKTAPRLITTNYSDANNRYEVTWQEWSISGCDGILSRASSIQKTVADIDEAASATFDLIASSQLTADAVNQYIGKINESMENLTEDQRKVLVDYIAKYKSESEDGEVVGITDENKQWWTDDTLYVDSDKLANGRVPIYQMVDGQKVYMGWVPADKLLNGVNTVQSGSQLEQGTGQKLAEVGKEVGETILGAGAVVFNSVAGISNKNNISYSKDNYLIEKAAQEEKAKEIGFITDSGSVANGARSYTLEKNVNREENGNYKIEYNNGDTRHFDSDGNLVIMGEKSEQTIVLEKVDASSRGDNTEKKYSTSNFNEDGTTTTQYFDENGNIIKNEVTDSQGQAISSNNNIVNNVNPDVVSESGEDPTSLLGSEVNTVISNSSTEFIEPTTEIIYNEDGTIDSYVNTSDHDRLLISHKDPNTGLEINYSANGEYQASINGKIFSSGNQANGDFISVDGNNVTIYKNNIIATTTTLAAAEQVASTPEMTFDSESQTFVEPVEILDDSSTVSYANNIPSQVATFDSDTGKFIYRTIDENGNTITTDANGNTTTIDANGYKTTVEADGSIVEEPF